jgi:hypothetical protein
VPDLRLRILQSRFQNNFFKELAAAIVDEATRLGATADVVNSQVEAEPEDVFLLLPTHEYTALEGPGWTEQPMFTGRAIGLTAEQPSSPFFERNVGLAGKLAAAVDFSPHAVRAYRARGLEVEHVPFGWTPSWDRFTREATYERDVLFLGCQSVRREEELARLARVLWSRETRLVVSDNGAPNWSQDESFVTGEHKRSLLASSRVLVNIHQSNEPYFEWLRAVEAAHCGTVIVSEPGLHTEPFVSGKHMVTTPAAGMSMAIEELLDDPDALVRLRTAAYELIREHPFARGVEKLLDIAESVRRRHRPGAGLLVGPTRRAPLRPELKAHWERPGSETTVLRQAIREIRLELLDLRRTLRAGSQDATPFIELRTPAWRAERIPRLSVLMALYNHEEYVTEALESVATGSYTDLEIVVTNDGSTDGSRQRVLDWMDRSPHVPMTLITHPVNRGLPRSRNQALEHARGEFAFVLDADNSVVPTGLARLVAALDADPEATFAYGALQRFDATGPVGMMGLWPWQPWRLRYYNYIDAMALIRTHVLRSLGGYTVDRRVYGWEDYDLWCRIAEAGGHAAHVPTMVGRYRTSASSMLSLTNISADAAFDALRERAPRVMGGALEPRSDGLTDWLGDFESARTGRDAWLREWEVGRK